MISIEKVSTSGWETAVCGMRNPLNSWELSDSEFTPEVNLGPKDLDLMRRLVKAGPEHRKYLRMIHVQMGEVVAPLYWWKEAKTYSFMIVNSCSTMHKIHANPFTINDFSHEHLTPWSIRALEHTISALNKYRESYLETKDKNDWWQMIQLLPASYNQRRTLDLNYETVINMIRQRDGHKLDEWNQFVKVLKGLPYITELLKED